MYVLCFSLAQNVTVEDVITSYTQACQKLNCKQIPKLIRQLQVTYSVQICLKVAGVMDFIPGNGRKRDLNGEVQLRLYNSVKAGHTRKIEIRQNF